MPDQPKPHASAAEISELDARIEMVRRGERPDWMPQSDFWWASEPIRTGALGTGREAHMEWVWRNRALGVTIYQPIGINEDIMMKFAEFMRHKPPQAPRRRWTECFR